MELLKNIDICKIIILNIIKYSYILQYNINPTTYINIYIYMPFVFESLVIMFIYLYIYIHHIAVARIIINICLFWIGKFICPKINSLAIDDEKLEDCTFADAFSQRNIYNLRFLFTLPMLLYEYTKYYSNYP